VTVTFVDADYTMPRQTDDESPLEQFTMDELCARFFAESVARENFIKKRHAEFMKQNRTDEFLNKWRQLRKQLG
jgi:hypothetical protein